MRIIGTFLIFLALAIPGFSQGKATRATQATRGTGEAVSRELASSWPLWTGFACVGLIGVAVVAGVGAITYVAIRASKR